ncbi:MAG: SH3 domain-containing protein [Desulfurivibrionaceae bacterium]
MTKKHTLFRPSLLCCFAGALFLALGINANAAPPKASPKATSEKSVAKTTSKKTPTPATEYVSVLKDGANIRSGPDTNKEILWTVFKGFPLKVSERKGKWALVEDFEGDKGWIANELIAKEKTVIVKATTANLRAGAGKDYEIVAEVKQGVVFKSLTTEGDWNKVKHADGTTGWILGKLLWPN